MNVVTSRGAEQSSETRLSSVTFDDDLTIVNFFLTLWLQLRRQDPQPWLWGQPLAVVGWLTGRTAELQLAAETSWSGLHQSPPVRWLWHAAEINVINLSPQSAGPPLTGELSFINAINSSFFPSFNRKRPNFTSPGLFVVYCRLDLWRGCLKLKWGYELLRAISVSF